MNALRDYFSRKRKEIPLPECHLFCVFLTCTEEEEDNEPTSNFLRLGRVPVAEQKEENQFTHKVDNKYDKYIL